MPYQKPNAIRNMMATIKKESIDFITFFNQIYIKNVIKKIAQVNATFGNWTRQYRKAVGEQKKERYIFFEKTRLVLQAYLQQL